MRFKRFDKTVPALEKENEGNAGYDLFSRIKITMQPNEVAMIPLNIATEIPSYMVGLLFQRSSTYKKWGVKLTNGVGVIDALYRGDGDEWCAQFKHETDREITINVGDKVCQALFLPLASGLLPQEVDKLGNEDRGGFGSTGSSAYER